MGVFDTFRRNKPPAESSVVPGPCCFCGEDIQPSAVDPCRVSVETAAGKWQVWCCHSACFKGVLAVGGSVNLDIQPPTGAKRMRHHIIPIIAAALAGSCNTPTKPTTEVAAVTDVRYQHVVAFSLDAGMRVELEYWDCSTFGLPPGSQGPSVCLLASDEAGQFRCPDADFMIHVPTTCDSRIDVLIRTASRNPLLQTAHDIYLNGTRVSRLSTDMSLDYPRESGSFRIDSNGHIR